MNELTTENTEIDVKIDTEEPRDYTALAKQCAAEYTLCWKHQKVKKDEAEIRLKLLNNQRRDPSSVGDTTMFTVMQTVIASLYIDQLSAEMVGREEGDEETGNNLTAMAEFDYDEMGKAMLDYDWIWDTCFFGRGLMAMEEYERDPTTNTFVPMPSTIDPLIFLRDPLATSVNGYRNGKGAMRFGGFEVSMGKLDMEDHPDMFKNKLNFSIMSYGSGLQSIMRDAIEARDQAQGRQPLLRNEDQKNLGDNAQYDVTIWYTYFEGAKYKVYLINDRKEVIGLKKIERKKGKRFIWPIVDRALYPTSHDWDGTSIPDLTEDKQRARAVAQNLGLKMMKADLEPMYIYDSNRITNRNDLNFAFNKFIPANLKDGESVAGAIQPLNKVSPNMNLLDFIYTSLDMSAQKATATSDIKMGLQASQQRTLGENNMVQANSDTRYSLAAKVLGWSEAEFWYHWYALYDENFADKIDEKILRIVGAFGAKWRPIKRGDIIGQLAPDIKIESKVVSRAKQLEERQMLTDYLGVVFGDPTANRRYGLRELGKLSGLGKDQIDRLLPQTIDERIAEDQNELLNRNKLVPVLPEDDHGVHLEIHSKARDTHATYSHIESHKKALSIKKTRPELFPMDQTVADMQAGKGSIQPVPMGSGMGKPIQPSQTSNMPAPQ